jgi:hypothetical protein
MALPEIIEELFSARYEFQTGIFGDKEKALERYHEILSQAVKRFGCKPEELIQVIGPRYRRWVAENKLPQPPRG